MLERKDFMPINYLKKESYTGSFKGMRYKMAKGTAKEGEVLTIIHWPEPYGFDATKETLKTKMETSFDEEGIQKGIAWLNEAYETFYHHEGV